MDEYLTDEYIAKICKTNKRLSPEERDYICESLSNAISKPILECGTNQDYTAHYLSHNYTDTQLKNAFNRAKEQITQAEENYAIWNPINKFVSGEITFNEMLELSCQRVEELIFEKVEVKQSKNQQEDLQ